MFFIQTQLFDKFYHVLGRVGNKYHQDVPHLSTENFDKIPQMVINMVSVGPMGLESLKNVWNSLLCPPGALIFLKTDGLRNCRFVMEANEFCAITVRMEPFRENGMQGFRYPEASKVSWDHGARTDGNGDLNRTI